MNYRLILFLCLTCGSAVEACNIPVFRYALERWRPDVATVVVFHDAELTSAQQEFVEQLKTKSVAAGGDANVELVIQNVAEVMEDSVGLLWEVVRRQPDFQLPYVVVRCEAGGQTVNGWHGSLENAGHASLLTSPVRKTLSDRLLAGHSAVWLILKSGHKERDQAVRQLLSDQLQLLSHRIPLPEGIGLPGSELFADIPLLMRFSVLEIDPANEREQFLIELLKGFEPTAVAGKEPLIVPVFGRGRALEVIPADVLNAGLIEDLTLFLCGACSCQVKERNPGFDLLITTDWEQELFGEDGLSPEPRITVAAASGLEATEEAVTVAIPPGSTDRSSDSAPDQQRPQAATQTSLAPDRTLVSDSGTSVSWAIMALLAVVSSIVMMRVLKS